MNDVISSAEAPPFNTDLITAFALGALPCDHRDLRRGRVSVSLRREIAIRMALGAQRVDVARLVLMSGAKVSSSDASRRACLTGCVTGQFLPLRGQRNRPSSTWRVS
jgi:hypothetical protein